MEQRARFGMALFLLNQAVLFFMLIAGFVYFRTPAHLPVAVYTACLLASGFALWRNWRAATLALGVIFLYGELSILRAQFATTFFTLTAVHAAHVVVGLVLIGLRPAQAAVALYWYFVAAVWIAIVAAASIV